jgi:5'-nucleotidase
MNVLMTNDDGIHAAGIWALYDAFVEAGHDVWVIAPKVEQSAKSHSITTREALRIENLKNRVWSVSGTPADCILLGFEHILLTEPKPDLVISGINDGPNVGSDVLYSGTVAGAVEAMRFGYKAIAISLNEYNDQKYETAAKALLYLIDKGILDFIGHRELLNINVPNVAFADIKGYVVCQAGFSRYKNIINIGTDGRKKDVYWIGGAYEDQDHEECEGEVDYLVVRENKVAISPLIVDYNNYEKIERMRGELGVRSEE